MSLGQLLILHLMAGVGVAGAVFLATQQRRGGWRWFLVFSAVVFWPMYLPLILQRSTPRTRSLPADLDQLIDKADRDLDAALNAVNGSVGAQLSGDNERLRGLRQRWTEQVERLHAMDRLLSVPESLTPLTDDANGRLRESREALVANMSRLRHERDRQLADLMSDLAEARELVSLIHLAAFSSDTVSDELTERIAAIADSLIGSAPPNQVIVKWVDPQITQISAD